VAADRGRGVRARHLARWEFFAVDGAVVVVDVIRTGLGDPADVIAGRTDRRRADHPTV